MVCKLYSKAMNEVGAVLEDTDMLLVKADPSIPLMLGGVGIIVTIKKYGFYLSNPGEFYKVRSYH